MASILHNELYTRVWVFPLRARPGWLIVSSWPVLKYATWPSGLLRFRVDERNKTECSRSFCLASNRWTLEPRQSAVDFVQLLSSVSSSLFPFLFKRFRPSLFFRLVPDENSSPTFVYSRSRYLESDHLTATILLRKTVLFIADSNTVRPNTRIKQN